MRESVVKELQERAVEEEMLGRPPSKEAKN